MDVDETTTGRDARLHDNAAGQDEEDGEVQIGEERPMDVDDAAATESRVEEPLPGLDPVQGHPEGEADHVSRGEEDDEDEEDSGQVNVT